MDSLDYKTTSVPPDLLTTLHIIIIDSEFLTTKRPKEVLQFARNRNPTKLEWKLIKEAVKSEEPLKIRNGKVIDERNPENNINKL